MKQGSCPEKDRVIRPGICAAYTVNLIKITNITYDDKQTDLCPKLSEH